MSIRDAILKSRYASKILMEEAAIAAASFPDDWVKENQSLTEEEGSPVISYRSDQPPNFSNKCLLPMAPKPMAVKTDLVLNRSWSNQRYRLLHPMPETTTDWHPDCF